MKVMLLTLLILSSSLTTLSVFADDPKPKREYLVSVAFEQIPEIVDFAARSPEFQAQLTPKEIEQLTFIWRITEQIRMVRQWGKDMPDAVAIPKIEFSEDREPFQLNPGEALRLAVTSAILDDPIMFYLPYLNSPNFDPTYLDMIQLMIHELGRKLGAREDEGAIHTMAAKLRLFLAPYYQKTEWARRSRIELISLPGVWRPQSFRPRNHIPHILVNDNGVIVYHRIDLSQVVGHLQRFTSSPEGSGNIMEQSTYRVTDLQVDPPREHALSFGIRFNVETQSQLVLLDPKMSMSPGPQISAKGHMLYPNPRIYGLIAPTAGNIQIRTRVNTPRPDGIPQMLYLNIEGWNYADVTFDAEVTRVKLSGRKVNVELSSRFAIKTLQLLIEAPHGNLLVTGLKTALGKYEFNLPTPLPNAKVRALVVNGEGQTLLPEVLALSPQGETVEGAQDTGLKKLEIFSGNSWQKYDGSQIIKANAGPVRLRLTTARSDKPLRQIRLRWNAGAAIYWDKPEQVTGVYAHVTEETFDQPQLTQQNENENIYEFVSTHSLLFQKPKTLHDIVGVKDSHRRLIKELLVTSNDLNTRHVVFSPMLRIFNREFIEMRPDCDSEVRKPHS